MFGCNYIWNTVGEIGDFETNQNSPNTRYLWQLRLCLMYNIFTRQNAIYLVYFLRKKKTKKIIFEKLYF